MSPENGGATIVGTDMSDRLAQDAELCLHLRTQGFRGADWDRFVHELLAYGLAGISGLIGSGVIFTESALVGRAVGGPPVGLSPQDVDEMAGEVVLRGFRLFFERGLIKGEWSPSGGRTLAQYFRHACVREFSNVFRTWERAARKWQAVDLHGDLGAIDHLRSADPAPSAPDDRLEALATLLTEDDLVMFSLIADGAGYREVGEKMGRSVRWVERRVASARRRARDFRAGASERRS